MRINALCCKLGGLLLLALATMTAFHRHSAAAKHPVESKAAQPVESKAAQGARTRIVDQVEPLCRMLFPEQDVLRFKVSPADFHHRNIVHDNLWTIDCQDTDSNDIASLTWNPDTKRMLRFSPTLYYLSHRQKHSPQRAIEEKIEEKQAVALARAWAARLRPISGEALQQSKYQAQRNSFSWTVRLQLPDGLAVLWINAQSGELENAFVQDTPIPGIPDANTAKRK